jgi:hypothetical protein
MPAVGEPQVSKPASILHMPPTCVTPFKGRDFSISLALNPLQRCVRGLKSAHYPRRPDNIGFLHAEVAIYVDNAVSSRMLLFHADIMGPG